jgi:AMIN domain
MSLKFSHKLTLGTSLFTIATIITLQSSTIANSANIRLEDWRFYPEYNQLEFTLSSSSQPKYFYLSQPARLVVDLPNTKLGRLPTQQSYSGAIQRVRLSQLNANVTRIVMDLAPGTNFDPKLVQFQQVPWQKPNHWALRISPGGYNSAQLNNSPNNFPQTNNQPVSPNIYPPQQPGNNQLPPNIYPQQPTNNQFPSYPQQPNNQPVSPNIYPPQQSGNNQFPGYPQQPTNNQFPSYPQQPTNNQFPSYPQQPTNNQFPTGTYPQNPVNSSQQPTITVPPLTPNNSPVLPGNSQLPPANFPNPSGGFVNTPPLVNQNFPATNNNPVNNPNSGVIEWGQTIPNR